MCLYEAHIGKELHGQKQGDAFLAVVFNFLSKENQERVHVTRMKDRIILRLLLSSVTI
jgi:hypothetical protein